MGSGLRDRRDIVLPVPSSRIASLLLPRGRTVHSRFDTIENSRGLDMQEG